MENETAIKIEKLGKKYTLGTQESYLSLRDKLSSPFKRDSKKKEDFWALKDIDLDIKKGETIGIIGRNGAGKSTLLKVLSQITPPTKGKITIDGRVASLLEVGTGFHPELSGRENIYLNGAILGMTRKEIKKKFDEIVAFSEIEKFLDTPVKRYSSGMYVRLAFAVAAHLEPEILIVDEVLAVGDAQFQKKCLGKMGEVGKSGRTVIFVSHNMTAIENLCSKTILLDEGRIVEFSKTSRVIAKYNADNDKDRTLVVWKDNLSPKNDSAKIRKLRILPNKCFDTDSDIEVRIDFEILRDGSFVGFTIMLHDEDNNYVFSSISNHENSYYGKAMPKGSYKTICTIPKYFLNSGKYKLSLNLFGKNFSDLVTLQDIMVFSIQDGPEVRGDFLGDIGGVTRPLLGWKTSKDKV